MNRIDSLWNLLKKYWWLILIIALLLVILDSLIRGLGWSNWAKSAEPPGPGAITLWGRSLWGWAGLLLVPLVLAIGGFLFQRSERVTDREIAEQRHETDQQIAKEARMDKTLDEYLKAMTSFLLQENSLLQSRKDDPIRNVARTQTITVIKRLDFERNQIVFQFLQEANLISTMEGDETNEVEKPIISLASTDLSGASLRGSDLSGANLQDANLQDANLVGADLRRADLQYANLDKANLQYANLQDADLLGVTLRRADLHDANLHDANLDKAKLQKADLRGARLLGVTLRRADLQDANLVGADLRGANLQEANLPEANLQGANLNKADLTGANLQEAIFTDISSMVEKGYFKGTTMPDGTIFSESTDLKRFISPTKEE